MLRLSELGDVFWCQKLILIDCLLFSRLYSLTLNECFEFLLYSMRFQVCKKHLLFTYMAIIFSMMGVIFYHIGTIQSVQPIISCHIGMVLCHTSTIFCGMPIILSVIFRIHYFMLSICCVIGIICSVIVQRIIPIWQEIMGYTD